MKHPEPNDAKAHPAGRVLGEAVWSLRTDNSLGGLWITVNKGRRSYTARYV